MTLQINRRRFIHRATLSAVLAALPVQVLSALAEKASGTNQFDKNTTAEGVTEGLDLSGLTFAITGANSGLGYETMRVLALRGAHVIGIARTQEKADKACDSINGDTTPFFLDLNDWGSVVKCADHIRQMKLPLDGLICNAGIMALPELELSNGVEKQFAVNHLGHFILINQLMEQVLTADQGRFVILSSGLHTNAEKGIEFDNLDGNKHYEPWQAYGVSKLANALCSRELSRRISSTGATSNCLHPGVIPTNLVKNLPVWQRLGAKYLGWLFMKTIPQGAATSCYLATNPALSDVSGYYFEDCNIAESSTYVDDDAMAMALWEISEKLTSDFLL
ncbi:MAG: NAD(P)-dependent dehydrogenase (short-subunit alcohol dehydrogenase family) [Oceanicoccus sp.]|jgi:NAD(P)-dependent dehydrogenase (short-subunit alcohol dehydrogenase family)